MPTVRFPVRAMTVAVALGTGLLLPLSTQVVATAEEGNSYQQTNLVSDLPGEAAVTDPNLVNPWGITAPPKGPFWISDNNAGVSTVYAHGQPFQIMGHPLVVNIPPPAGSAPGSVGAPTGVVFNPTDDFIVTEKGVSAAALFLFATEDGTISGWNPKVDFASAVLAVDRSAVPTAAAGAVYKGMARGKDGDRDLLFAANFRAGTIDVFDARFNLVQRPGAFTDRRIPAGFAPFDIANINGRLFVTYAMQNAEKHDDLAGPGHGFIDVFSMHGRLLRRFASRGALNSPWGLAAAPDDFGAFSNDLLVGNFGDGRINAYDLQSGRREGQLEDPSDRPITIPGLWGLAFGNDGLAGARHTLFFTAGIGDEKHGLFGSLQATS